MEPLANFGGIKNRTMKSFIHIVTLLLFLVTFLPCTAFADADLIPISVEKERSIGASIAKQVEEKYDSVDDPLIQKRYEEIGKRLAESCDRKELTYHFKVLKAKDDAPKEAYYNAFALPGGYVYMFDAMMEKLETDDKIAAVTAHEIGHISARHAVNRVQGTLGANLLMILAMATAQDGRSMAQVGEALNQLMLSYSREDEFEADKLSVKYLIAAEFNPEGAAGSLIILKTLRKEGKEMKYRNYRSHPYLSERIALVKAEIKGFKDFDSYINIPPETRTFH